jgi:DNA-binding CsgD family transcriptional regulator
MAAAAAVASASVTSIGSTEEWPVLDCLSALVDKSLVQADESDGSTRYRLLETVRHYAAERLALRAGQELDATRAAHRDHYLALVETASAHLRGRDERVWLDRLEIEFENIRAALAFSIADPVGAEPGLRLAAGLHWFCNMRGHGGEVLQALSVLLERPDAGRPTLARARALVVCCHLLDHFGSDRAASSMVGEALRIARGLGDDATAADALAQLCWLSFTGGDLGGALDRIDEAVGLARATGDPRLTSYVLGRRAVFKSEAGDLEAARADQEEAITLSRAAGNSYRLVISLANLGVDKLLARDGPAARALLEEASMLADDNGYQTLSGGVRENLGFIDLIDADPSNAARHFTASLNTARITGVTSYIHGALLGLALAAGADGDPAVAATLHGIADERYERAGRGFESIEASMRDHDHARLRATLGDAAFEASYQRGRTLSRAEADVIALVTAVAGPDLWAPASASSAAAQAATGGPAGTLSDREREIVALLAGGATDGQIADRLFLSVNTVRSHLERIRDKTGARRRTELARYAIAAGIDPVTPAR